MVCLKSFHVNERSPKGKSESVLCNRSTEINKASFFYMLHICCSCLGLSRHLFLRIRAFVAAHELVSFLKVPTKEPISVACGCDVFLWRHLFSPQEGEDLPPRFTHGVGLLAYDDGDDD